MSQAPLYTAIIHTYNRPELLKKAVEALQRQTYTNLEIILINNGATPQTVKYLHQVAVADNRVKLVHFEENQFSWDDPVKYLDICCNAALAEATGEYVWLQQDDDLFADDYVEKMVALFQGNTECTTAAGLAVSIDIEGNVNDDNIALRNLRPTYTPGREIALDYLSGSGNMFAAPGEIFTIKRDVLVKAGGYHRAFEFSQIYGIVPFGVTGFDRDARFYWRHHEGQLNKQMTATGSTDYDSSLGLLNDWQLEQRWNVFGADVAQGFVRLYRRKVYDGAARSFVVSLYSFRLKPAIRIMRKMWPHPYFWYRSVVRATQKPQFLIFLLPVIKPSLKRMFRMCPALANLTPALGKLNKKVNR